ncbi:hypothetical protein ACYCCF_13745 [Streptomyces argenteolus]|uniref:hypothetical protein n=1 Tax=Streptomyces sp. NPDC025273 TaxID=3155251 RepID=UPI003407BDCE
MNQLAYDDPSHTGPENAGARTVQMKGADGLSITWPGSDEDDAPFTYRRTG